MENLIERLKIEIINNLNIRHLTADEFDIDDPLFGDKVGLDSIDAIELIILMERNYNVTLEDPKQGPKVFYSIRTMSEYINNQINAASKDSMAV